MKQNEKSENPQTEQPFGAAPLLGRRCMWTKSSNHSLWPTLGTVDDSEHKLGEMETYPSALADTIEALEKKGMRFEEVSFDNGDIGYLDNNIVVFRGNAAKLLQRAFHGEPCGLPTHQIAQDSRLLVNGLSGPSRSIDGHILKMCEITHNNSLPNSIY